MKILYSWVVVIALLGIPIVMAAQTTTIRGVVREEIPVKEGKILVYLPNDIRSGEMITGTVIGEPAGNTEKEKSLNNLALQKYKIKLGEHVFTVGHSRQMMRFPQFPASPSMNLLDEKNIVLKTLPITLTMDSYSPARAIIIPSHALIHSPLSIKGPFDGNATNTKIKLDGIPLEILAESERQSVCNLPQTSSGPHTLVIEENGMMTEKKISAVDMNLTASKTNLRTGQRATITVMITGLHNINSNSTLFITNTSPSTITLSGGNTQQITISPSQVTSSGNYTQTFEAQSLATGNFTVSADLKLPAPGEELSSKTGDFAACAAAKGLLLSLQECEKMTNLIRQSKPSSKTGQTTIPSSIPANLELTTQGNNHHFSIAPIGGATITTVIWTISSAAEENSLLKADTVIKANKSSLQIKNNELPATANTIQAMVYSNSSPPLAISYPVTKYYNSSLYAVTSSVIDQWEKQRDDAKTKSDAEWQKVKAAQEKRDELTTTTAQLKKDSLILVQTAAELKELDDILEQTGPMYMNEMKRLADELASLLKNNPPTGINWRERCAKLEQKLINCQSQLSALSLELQQLNNNIAQMEADRDAAFKAGTAAIRNAGYANFGNKHFDKDGNMTAEFGIIMVSSDGQKGSVIRGIPAGALKQVSAQQQKIKDLNKAIQDAKARKKEIEEMLKNLPAQCEEITKQLEECRKEQEKDLAAYDARQDYEWEIWEICHKIMALFSQLQDWCKAHPKVCNVDQKLNELAKNCPPRDPQQFQQYWNTVQQTISYKQGIEESYASRAESTATKIETNEKEIKRQDSIAMAHRDSMWHASTAAAALQQQINNEIARQKAASTQAANERRRQLKTICAEFMRSQMKEGEANDALLETIAGIKTEIEKIGSALTDGSVATDGLGIYNESKRNRAALVRRLELLRSRLEALAEAMEGIAELAGYAGDILTIANNIAALTNEGNDALTSANKFGAILSSLNIVLGHISEKFPILGFFTSYISYLTEGYTAGVNGAKEIGGLIVRREAYKLVQTTDCPGMVDEYGKQKSVEDVIASLMKRFNHALTNSGIRIEPYNKTQLKLFEEELRKAVIRKMLDCCLRWVTTEG